MLNVYNVFIKFRKLFYICVFKNLFINLYLWKKNYACIFIRIFLIWITYLFRETFRTMYNISFKFRNTFMMIYITSSPHFMKSFRKVTKIFLNMYDIFREFNLYVYLEKRLLNMHYIFLKFKKIFLNMYIFIKFRKTLINSV